MSQKKVIIEDNAEENIYGETPAENIDGEIKELKEVYLGEINFEEEAKAENEKGSSRMKVWGIVQEADTVNRNKRVYPKEVMEDSIKELQKRVAEKRVFGEVDHPPTKGFLKDTSHLVTKVWWDEDNPKRVMAEMLILNTPTGEVIKEIIRAGGKPGFSSRGAGKTTQIEMKGHGKVEKIEPGFRFESFDFVMDPSVRQAKILKIAESLKIDLGQNNLKEDAPMPDVLTLDELKSKHSAVAEAYLAEAKSAFVAEQAEKLKAERETLVADLRKQIKEEMEKENAIQVKDEEIDKLRNRLTQLEAELNAKDADLETQMGVLESIVKVLTEAGLIRAAQQSVQDDEKVTLKAKVDELQKAVEDANAKVSEASAKIDDLTKQLDSAKNEISTTQKVADKAKVEAFVAEKVANHRFGNVLKSKLSACETVEEAETKLKELDELVESVQEGITPEKPEGKGVQTKIEETPKPDPDAVDIRERQRAKAGIRVVNS